MSSPLEQCRELLGDIEMAGGPFSTDEEEAIDWWSDTIYSAIDSHVSTTGELNLPAAMPDISSLIAELSNDEDKPSERVIYGAILLAAATVGEARSMIDYL